MLKSLSTGTEEDGTPRMFFALKAEDISLVILFAGFWAIVTVSVSMYSSTCLVSVLHCFCSGHNLSS